MTKQYTSIEKSLSPRPRSKRRRETGEGTSSGNITVIQNGGGGGTSVPGETHTHDNKSVLDKLGIDGEGYGTITEWKENKDGDLEKSTEKIKAGYADKAGVAQNLAENSSDWQTIDDKIKEQARLDENKFLRKDQDDETPHNLGIGKNLNVGEDADINGNLGVGGDAHVLGKTTTNKLDANDAVIRNRASSLDFISGFISGKGWAVTKEEVENALGVIEKKYHLEIDKLTVRGQMRVYEMIISQLLGENDNRVFTAMMEVDHYDASTGRVYFDNKGGRLYNPFREDDYIKVQQYNPAGGDGYVIKSYELIISGIYSGYEKGERVDWVTFKNFTPADLSPADVIAEGDTFIRWDNATDAERKGLITITTIGPQTPHIDILHGAKTDPDNALKGRIGNLSGIRHHLFGWLSGFGEYLTNLYAVGDFRLRQTGESLDAKIEATKSSLAASYQRQRYELTEDDNFLTNATFTDNLRAWIADNDISFLTVGGECLFLNRSTMVDSKKIAVLEEREGRNMLHLYNSQIKQLNADIRKPETHKEYAKPANGEERDDYTEISDTVYFSVKFLALSSGVLTWGFENSASQPKPYQSQNINSSPEWQMLTWDGKWDGKGDFSFKYTGEMWVAFVSLTTKPLENYKLETSTKFIQTDAHILLYGQKINNINGTVTQLGIDLDAAEERISLYAEKYDELNGTVTQLGIDLDAAEERISLYAEKYDELNGTVTQLGIDLDTANGRIDTNVRNIRANTTDISKIRVEIGQITTSVTELSGNVSGLQDGLAGVKWDLGTANNSIDGLQSSLEGLDEYVYGALEDDMISDAEKVAIEKYLKTLESTMADVENVYTTLYGNDYLELADKGALKSCYDSLVSAHKALVNSINTVISTKNPTVTASDKANVNNAFDDFNKELGQFKQKVESLYKAIEDKLKALADAAAAGALETAQTYASGLTKGESYAQSTNPWGAWTGGTEHEHTGAIWHCTAGGVGYIDTTGTSGTTIEGHTYRYVGGSSASTWNRNVWEDITDISAYTAYTKTTKDRIESVVTALTNSDGTWNVTAQSGILTTAWGTGIYTKVDALESRIAANESEISACLKDGEDVITAINMDTSGVTIKGAKIKLEGATTINSAFSVDDDGITHIGGFTVNATQIYSTNNKIVLKKNGSATIGNMTVATNGDITVSSGTFSGVINATKGISLGVLVSSSETINMTTSESLVVTTNTSSAQSGKVTVNLPSSPNTGQLITIRNDCDYREVKIVPRGSHKITPSNDDGGKTETPGTYLLLATHRTKQFIFDGSIWRQTGQYEF